MKTLLFLVVVAILGGTFYWNHRTSLYIEAQNNEIQKLKVQLDAQEKSRERSKEEQEAIVRDLRSRLQFEQAALNAAGDNLTKAKNFGTNQATVNQINTEAKDEHRALDEVNRQIQVTQQQLSQMNQEGKSASEVQKAAHLQRENDIKLQIQEQSNRIKSAETEIRDLKTRKYDLTAKEQWKALSAQMPQAREVLKSLQSAKRQIDAEWSSQKTMSDTQLKSYKGSLQQTLIDLKQRRDEENKKLLSTNTSLGQAKGAQTSVQENLDQLNLRYNDQRKKVEAMEQELKQEEERLKSFE